MQILCGPAAVMLIKVRVTTESSPIWEGRMGSRARIQAGKVPVITMYEEAGENKVYVL